MLRPEVNLSLQPGRLADNEAVSEAGSGAFAVVGRTGHPSPVIWRMGWWGGCSSSSTDVVDDGMMSTGRAGVMSSSTAGMASMVSVSAVVMAVTVVQVMRMASAFVSWVSGGVSGTRGGGSNLMNGGRRQFGAGDLDIRVGHHGLHCGQRCTFGVRWGHFVVEAATVHLLNFWGICCHWLGCHHHPSTTEILESLLDYYGISPKTSSCCFKHCRRSRNLSGQQGQQSMLTWLAFFVSFCYTTLVWEEEVASSRATEVAMGFLLQLSSPSSVL